MEIGLLNNKDAWGYDLKPLQNKIIDQLSLAWPVASGENGVSLIEREKKYNNVEQFLDNLPARDEIALYNYSLKNNFLLDNYEPGKKDNLLNFKFRGAYQFYTYIKKEELNYVFNFFDLNINSDNDPIEIKIYSKDSVIYSTHLADEKTVSNDRQTVIKIADLPEGVYRFSIIANDDVITKSITSRQSQFALINKVWLAEGNKENLILFTNSRLVNAQTVNPSSLGKINIGDNYIELNQTYKQFSSLVLNNQIIAVKSGSAGVDSNKKFGPVKIELPKDDIIISGDGVFSFSENSLLDPRFKNVDGNLDINGEKINYVLTNYKTPINFDGWQTAVAEFDLTKAYQENGKYQFLISVPTLKAEELIEGEIIIKEIKVDLSGTSLRKKLNKYFNR